MGIWKPRWASARATPESAVAIESAAADGVADDGGLDHADHDHPYAHEAVSLCAEHAGTEHADAWTQLHRG